MPAFTSLVRWWRSRGSRERWLMLGLAGIGIAALLIAGVLRPLLASRAAALAEISQRDAALAQLAALPAGAAAPYAAADTRPVTAIVTETAPEFGLVIRQLEPEGAGARLLIEDAGFAEILAWIEALERDRGLVVTAVEMDRRPEPGIVGARLTLQR